MRKRRSLTRQEQSETLQNWMKRHDKTQRDLSDWLAERGVLVSPQYLNDVLRLRRDPGPRFKEVFKQITGVTLTDGLIEDEGKRK